MTIGRRDLKTCVTSQARSRLRRIQGQISGIEKMIEQGKAFPEVSMQLKAATSAIRSLEGVLLGKHLKQCLSSKGGKRRVDELVGLIGRSL